MCNDGPVPGIIESERRQGISSDDALEHHDLLLHQGGEQVQYLALLRVRADRV